MSEWAKLLVEPNGARIADAPCPRFLLPGSFNPLHDGHRGMFTAATRRLGSGGAFELSVTNVEKAALGDDEVRRRLIAFKGYAPLWLTRAPTFVEKARLFPGAVFVDLDRDLSQPGGPGRHPFPPVERFADSTGPLKGILRAA